MTRIEPFETLDDPRIGTRASADGGLPAKWPEKDLLGGDVQHPPTTATIPGWRGHFVVIPHGRWDGEFEKDLAKALEPIAHLWTLISAADPVTGEPATPISDAVAALMEPAELKTLVAAEPLAPQGADLPNSYASGISTPEGQQDPVEPGSAPHPNASDALPERKRKGSL